MSGSGARENLGLSGWLAVAESVSFMAAGMTLLRTGILAGAASAATYRRLMLAGYGGGLALHALLVTLAVRTGRDMGDPAVGTDTWTLALAVFEPARLLVTLGHIGAIVTLFGSGALGAAATLRSLGRMALTVYCLQSLLTSAPVLRPRPGRPVGLPTLWMAALIWIASGLFCRAQLSRFATGPAERLLRSLAYDDWTWLARASTAPHPVRYAVAGQRERDGWRT